MRQCFFFNRKPSYNCCCAHPNELIYNNAQKSTTFNSFPFNLVSFIPKFESTAPFEYSRTFFFLYPAFSSTLLNNVHQLLWVNLSTFNPTLTRIRFKLTRGRETHKGKLRKDQSDFITTQICSPKKAIEFIYT